VGAATARHALKGVPYTRSVGDDLQTPSENLHPICRGTIRLGELAPDL
jgi:hypothetical protein